MAGQQSSPPSSPSINRTNAAVYKLIQRLLFQSTIFIIFLQFISNLVFPDHNADAFRTLITPPSSIVDRALRFFFSGLSRWDGEHFLHIAQYGYTFEHSIAFFPLFPFLTYVLASFWFPFVPCSMLTFPTALMATAVILNAATFFGTAWSIFALTKNVFSIVSGHHESCTALIATIMFILNPANIFFRAAYTESNYAFLTFLGLNCLFWKRPAVLVTQQKPGRNLLEAAVCFGLALTVRSNGLLNLGYLFYYYGSSWLKPFLASGGTGRLTNSSARSGRVRSVTYRRHTKELAQTIPVFILALVAAVTPFLLAQYYQYQTFCERDRANRVSISYDLAKLAKERGYILPGDFENLHWCRQKTENSTPIFQSITALPYTAVQGKYWQVGLFGYYQLKKLPLFILASPTFLVAISACVYFLTEMRLSNGDWMSKMINPHGFLPFVLHVIVLSVVGCFFINVEVFTRMLFSSTPLVYWYCASFFLEKIRKHDGEKSENSSTDEENSTTKFKGSSTKADKNLVLELENLGIYGVVKWLWRRGSTGGKLILVWFLGYAIIGTAAFANFLPWT